MKTSLSYAAAQALLDLGVEIVTYVPGYGGTEVFQAYNELSLRNTKFSFHEEAAFTVAHAAAICGKRSASLMKAHGLMKAANSVIDSLYTEITAGTVVLVFEDKSGRHSDNILDITDLLNSIPIRFIQSQPNTTYNDVIEAFKLSEEIKQPVVLLMDSLIMKLDVVFEPRQDLKKNFTYYRDIYQHVVHPMLSDYQYKVFTAKKLAGDHTTITRPPLPNALDDFPERAKNAAKKYQPFFEVFKNYRGSIVTGDTTAASVFAFPPYNCVDIVTYMGGSIPLAIGAYLAGNKNVWALSGDFGFISAGSIGLTELLQRETPIKVVLFYNKQAASTGGQLINKKIMRHLLAGFEKYIIHIADPFNPIEIDKVLNEASLANEFKLMIVDYPE